MMNLSENCTWNCGKLMKSGYEIQIFHLSTRLWPWESYQFYFLLLCINMFFGHRPLKWWHQDHWTGCGHLATKEFRTLTITFWHLRIPFFYMIFLTIIYNWMCSWLYFFINLLCTIFPWTLQKTFHLGWGNMRWVGGEGYRRVFYLLHTQTPSSRYCVLAYPFEFSSPSSSYTVYYQFWYKLYINI